MTIEQQDKPLGWISPRPTECQLCDQPFKDGDTFIDGKTTMGPWGILCEGCHRTHGVGLGTGSGQQYDWTTLEKVAG